MTQVDFYILTATSTADRLNFTCRLIDKARRLGKRAFITTQDEQQSLALDQLLWTFRPESFIGHSVSTLNQDTCEPAPVSISHNDDSADHHDLLINLGGSVPACFSRFERLAEVVVQLEPILKATRHNYTFYRDRGYPIQSHHLGTNTPR